MKRFFAKPSTLGNRTLAITTAKEIVSIYKEIKEKNPNTDKKGLIKKTLERSKYKEAKHMLEQGFPFNDETLQFTIYNLVVEMSPINKRRISPPKGNAIAYIEAIDQVLGENNLLGE